jgi:galactose mutarotase-like enzyme
MRCRIGAATFTSGSTLVFGLGSARDDTPDSVTAHAWFRMEGANSTTLVYAESDDGTRDVNDISTGVTLGTTFKRFVIDFTGGKSDVKFYIDGQRVCASQTFDMSAYSSGLQPIFQLQKAANTNADSFVCDYIKVECKR